MSGLRGLVVGCALALLVGCARAEPPIHAPPVDAAGAQAEAVSRRCARAAERARCLEGSLLEVLRADGVAAAMAVLDRLAGRDEEIRREGHVYAHAIGLAAYTGAAEVGERFAQCTPAFQSGCYHGVIQAFFADPATEAADGTVVNRLCAGHRGEGGQRWLLFQCAHGMGHGLTMLFGHDLPRALEGCDLVADAWEREACYGGAFMENIVQATSPHHGVGRPQPGGPAHHGGEHAGHGAHGGHGAGAASGRGAVLERSDPHAPCSALDARYLASCYQMQTSAMLHLTGGDLPAVAGMCGEAPELFRPHCFQSLGRDISAYTLQDHAAALRLCALAPARYQPSCHEGFAKNLVDLTARAEDGLAYCRVIPAGESKTACYRAIGEQAWVLLPEATAREGVCGAAEPEYREVCRTGADLPRRREG